MKTIRIIFVIALPLLGLALMSHVTRSGGSPGGKTGSPGDGGATCTQCHSATVQVKEGWITADIPENGYVPGEVYTLTLSATQTGINRFGFEFTAENASGEKAGSFDTESQNQIKLVNASKAVTHTSSGISGSGGTKSWTFKWTAPAEGTGQVGFYAAVNAANGDGGTGGDDIYTSSLLVDEQIDNSIENFLLEGWLKVYPNPATDEVRFHMNGLKAQDLGYRIFNLHGQLIKESSVKIIQSNSVLSVPVDDLAAGNYIIHFQGDGFNLKGRFLIIRP